MMTLALLWLLAYPLVCAGEDAVRYRLLGWAVPGDDDWARLTRFRRNLYLAVFVLLVLLTVAARLP